MEIDGPPIAFSRDHCEAQLGGAIASVLTVLSVMVGIRASGSVTSGITRIP